MRRSRSQTVRLRAVVSALLTSACACAMSLGCSRGQDEQPKVVNLGGNVIPPRSEAGTPPAPAVNAQTSGYGDSRRDQDVWQPLTHVMITQTVILEGGAAVAAAAAAAKSNPDDAVLERTRLAAGNCFRALPGYVPRRSAHISLTVISTGTVSRAEVTSPDTTDEGVMGCIHNQAMSASFSDNGDGPLRTYAIDVQVIANGGGGGR